MEPDRVFCLWLFFFFLSFKWRQSSRRGSIKAASTELDLTWEEGNKAPVVLQLHPRRSLMDGWTDGWKGWMDGRMNAAAASPLCSRFWIWSRKWARHKPLMKQNAPLWSACLLFMGDQRAPCRTNQAFAFIMWPLGRAFVSAWGSEVTHEYKHDGIKPLNAASASNNFD